MLAGFAGVAISNAHQFHPVNTELAAGGSELDHANQTLQALSSRVLWMLESERRLIAQELHDGIAQVLAGAILAADAIVSEPTDPLEGAEQLTSMLRDAVKDVRRISQGLGLGGMRERATLANGVLSIESGPGRGVHLTLEIPIEPEHYHRPAEHGRLFDWTP